MTDLKETEIIENENLNGRRALASIQQVTNISPIKNSDKLVVVAILGFRVVVAKTIAPEIGNLVIYIDADSIVSRDVAKMAGVDIKSERMTVVKRKIMGVVSDGIMIQNFPSNITTRTIGENVTAELKIEKSKEIGQQVRENKETKYEPAKFGMRKTDEDQVQGKAGKEIMAYFKNKPWSGRLKVDGSSGSCMIHPETKKFMNFSRNEENLDTKSVYHRVVEKYDLKKKLENVKGRYAPYYEVYGSKIQNNRLGLADGELKIAVFDMFDFVHKKYLLEKEMLAVCQDLDLPVAPLVCQGPKFNFTIDELRKMTEGNYTGTKNPREGIVFRLQDEYYTNIQEGDGHLVRASFKVINTQYKIAEGKVKQPKGNGPKAKELKVKEPKVQEQGVERKFTDEEKAAMDELGKLPEQELEKLFDEAYEEMEREKQKNSMLWASRDLLTKKFSTMIMNETTERDYNTCMTLLDKLEEILKKY